MRSVAIFYFAFLLTGCGTIEKTNDDSNISNSDFNKKPLVNYDSSADSFNLSEGSLLSNESIYRLDEDDLSDSNITGVPLSDIISLCYQKKYDKAFSLIDSYYSTYKKHPNYWNQVGSCYFLQGNDRKALLFYNQSLDMNKKYAPPLNNLGVMFIRKNEYQQAMEYLKKAARYSPQSRTPIFNLAHLYLQFGLVDRAQRLFLVLNSKYSFDIDVISGLGSASLLENNPNKALEYYKQIDDKYLWRPDIAINYAIALKQTGNKDGALEVYGKINKSKLGRYQDYYNKVGILIRR
jgi:tetratricopeptide (TPR) repeat protein